MALIARGLMVITGALMTFYVLSVIVLTAMGEHEELWDLADFDPQPFAPAPLGLVLALVFAVIFLLGILLTFWQAHLLLKLGRAHMFRALATGLRRSGIGLGMMWLGLYAFMNVVPITMADGRIPMEEMDISWLPFEIESVFLVLATVMVALADVLIRAAEIEDENNQFL